MTFGKRAALIATRGASPRMRREAACRLNAQRSFLVTAGMSCFRQSMEARWVWPAAQSRQSPRTAVEYSLSATSRSQNRCRLSTALERQADIPSARACLAALTQITSVARIACHAKTTSIPLAESKSPSCGPGRPPAPAGLRARRRARRAGGRGGGRGHRQNPACGS